MQEVKLEMEILEYQQRYKPDFVALNLEWVKRYFTPEQADYEVLDNVDQLLQQGSMIFLWWRRAMCWPPV